MGFKPLPAAIAIALALAIWQVPVPEGVSTNAWHLLALFVGIIAGIIGKAMPIGAMAVLAMTLVALLGVTVGETDAAGKAVTNPSAQAAKDALSSLNNTLIWMIGAAIMISRGLLKTGLGTRFGYMFLAIWGKRTLGVAYSLVISDLVLAPVTPSNTARGGAIVHPVMRAIAANFESDPEKGTEGRIGKYLALVNYHANIISCLLFVTATAPNPLVVKLIAEATGAEVNLTWTTWFTAMAVPGLTAMILMPLVLFWLYKPEITQTPDAPAMARTKLKEMGPMSKHEWIMLAVFGLLLVLWAGIPAMLFGKTAEIDATTTTFIGLSLLLISGVLTWDDVLKEKSAWDTIVWFAALVMMATFLNKLGLISWFSDLLGQNIAQMGLNWVAGCALLTLAYIYSHYMFASGTAHVTAMLAAFYSAGLALGAPPMLFALILAASSSIMMSLTHYASGSSPVIYGSGYVTMGEWWKAGFIMSIVEITVFASIGVIWWKILGYW